MRGTSIYFLPVVGSRTIQRRNGTNIRYVRERLAVIDYDDLSFVVDIG